MKTLTAAVLLATLMFAGCSGLETGPSAAMSPQAMCEQQRGGGVWMAAAGVCMQDTGR